MTLRITDDAMTSNETRHTALRAEAGWELSWLPDRTLDRNQAISGMTLAEAVANMQQENDDHTHRMWLHINQWADELGLTGPDAVVRVSKPEGFSQD